MLIVVCCVCVCGCVCLCFVCGSNFSYHTSRKSTSAKAKWPYFCALISQNWPLNTPNMTGCANLSSFREVAPVLTFLAKLF
jgi:hypothetical protein